VSIPPTYDELLRSLQQLELRFQALEKAHDELLIELQERLIKIQESIDAGQRGPGPTP